MGRLRTAVRSACWLLSGLVVAVPAFGPGGPLGPDLALADGGLRITGSIEGLVPGEAAELLLTVHNDGGSDVVVRRLTARVTGGGVAGCGIDALQLSVWTGSLVVIAGGAAQQPLAVQLEARQACSAATWQLSYAAVGS